MPSSAASPLALPPHARRPRTFSIYALHVLAWCAFLTQVPFLALKSSLTWYAWVWLAGALFCLGSIPAVRIARTRGDEARLFWALRPALWGSRISIAVVISGAIIVLVALLAR